MQEGKGAWVVGGGSVTAKRGRLGSSGAGAGGGRVMRGAPTSPAVQLPSGAALLGVQAGAGGPWVGPGAWEES